MANAILDLVGSPCLVSTGTKNLVIGTGGAADLIFLTNGTERLRIASDGTTTLAASLNFRLANNDFLIARNAADSGNINVLKVDANDDTVLNADTGDVIRLQIAEADVGVVDSATLKLGDSLDTSVSGVGQLFLRRNAANTTERIQTFGTSVQGYLAFDKGRGTAAAITALQLNDVFGSVVGVGFEDGTTSSHGPEISFIANENWSATAHGCNIKFLVVKNGVTSQVPGLWINREGTGNVEFPNGDIVINTAGDGIKIAEGANAKMGVGTLVNGTVTVSTTAVAATSRIHLTRLVGAGTTRGILTVGTITAATSFVIRAEDLSGNLSADDDSQVSWVILDPA